MSTSVIIPKSLESVSKRRLANCALEFLDVSALCTSEELDRRIEFLRNEKKLTVFQRTELGFNLSKVGKQGKIRNPSPWLIYFSLFPHFFLQDTYSARLETLLKLVAGLGSTECFSAFQNVVESLKEVGYEGQPHFTAGSFLVYWKILVFLDPWIYCFPFFFSCKSDHARRGWGLPRCWCCNHCAGEIQARDRYFQRKHLLILLRGKERLKLHPAALQALHSEGASFGCQERTSFTGMNLSSLLSSCVFERNKRRGKKKLVPFLRIKNFVGFLPFHFPFSLSLSPFHSFHKPHM